MAKQKQKAKQDKSHIFLDGYVAPWGSLGIIAYPNALKNNEEFTTFYVTNPQQIWAYEKTNFQSSSNLGLFDNSIPTWFLLGKRGEVVQFAKTQTVQIVQTQIPDAGTGRNRYGYVNKIANIAGKLYVCGYGRQVYKQENNKWIHIDKGMILPPGTLGKSLQSIDGFSTNDIYAVGLDGEIWHYDGKQWHAIQSPTNQHLHEVCCCANGWVYACGGGGVVLKGRDGKWEIIENKIFLQENIWGLAYFRNNIYVAACGGIAIIENNKLKLIDTGIKNIVGGKLRAGAEKLYYIEGDHIYEFDGTKWEEMICPDNK